MKTVIQGSIVTLIASQGSCRKTENRSGYLKEEEKEGGKKPGRILNILSIILNRHSFDLDNDSMLNSYGFKNPSVSRVFSATISIKLGNTVLSFSH